MAKKHMNRDALTTTRWVHAFEQDTLEGDVYRPDSAEVPLSRRPRQQLQFARDGTAVVLTPGPDDRLVESQATWAEEDGAVIVRTQATRARSAIELRIVKVSQKRLIVRAPGKSTMPDPA